MYTCLTWHRRFTNCYTKSKNMRCRLQSLHYRSAKAAPLAHLKVLVTSSRVLWKSTAAQVDKRLSDYGAQNFNSAFTTGGCCFISKSNWPIQTIISHVCQVHFTTVIPFTSRFRKRFLSFSSSHYTSSVFLTLHHARYIHGSSHSPWFDHSNQMWGRVMTILILQ